MVEINLEDPVVKGYLFYLCVLVVKIFIVTLLTVFTRWRKKVVISPEDVRFGTRFLGMHELTMKADDEDVERVRRAHGNDLENIPLFILTGFVYILTKPNVMVAMNLFRTFTAARILHTLVYAVVVVPQPARGIFFTIGFLINFYMLFVGLATFFAL